MKELLITLTILALAGMVVWVGVGAVDTANVTATATVQNISVTVSDGTVAYGTLAAGASGDTTLSGVNDSQTATNAGNVTENLNIRGTNSTSWTLAATAGSEQYVHKFCNNGICDTTPTWTALTTSNQTLTSGVGPSGTQEFDLRITTPTATSDYTQQSVNVVIQATAS